MESGGGIVKGEHILRFWNRASDTAMVLQRSLSPDGAADRELQARFQRWHDETVDLPGTYYLQVVHWIYRENRIAKARSPRSAALSARGRESTRLPAGRQR